MGENSKDYQERMKRINESGSNENIEYKGQQLGLHRKSKESEEDYINRVKVFMEKNTVAVDKLATAIDRAFGNKPTISQAQTQWNRSTVARPLWDDVNVVNYGH